MNILTIDIEDWFHILELDTTPNINQWHRLESRVEKNTYRLLTMFEKTNTKATFFFLGWVAEQFPHLVKDAHQAGHEIASHGYQHQTIYSQTQLEFREDITKAKKIIEDIIAKPIKGYRAPGFSLTTKTPWAIEEICKAGYEYDSSIFPGTHGHGGIENCKLEPHRLTQGNYSITEIPITLCEVFKQKLCFFGGGYFRLSPYFLIKKMSQRVNQQQRPVLYYLHPREIDPTHPRIPMRAIRRFKSYVNLKGTENKLRQLLRDFELYPIEYWLSHHLEHATEKASLSLVTE